MMPSIYNNSFRKILDIEDESVEGYENCVGLNGCTLSYLNACNEAEAQVPQSPERDALIEFIRNSERGVIKPYTSK